MSGRFGWRGSTRASTARSGGDRVDRREDRLLAQTLCTWVRQAERDAGERSVVSTDERAQLKALLRENRELRQANEILRKASAYFAQAEQGRRFKL